MEGIYRFMFWILAICHPTWSQEGNQLLKISIDYSLFKNEQG